MRSHASSSGLHAIPPANSALAALAEVSLQEHLSNVIRLRRGATLGLAAWLLFSAADWYIDAAIIPDSFWSLMTIRWSGAAIPMLVLLRLHRAPPPSPRMLSLLSLLSFGIASYTNGAVSILLGATSPYHVGLLLILVTHSACCAQPWRRGIPQLLTIVSSYPISIAVGVIFQLSPAAVHVWTDERTRATVYLNMVFVLCIAVFASFTSHLAWSMRRQIFESRSVGRYRLERRIGAGGMGEVWAAYHLTLKRNVAVKLLRSTARSSLSAISRFEREVESMTQLNHPNTVRVFDFGVTQDGICYYAMELLEGEDLATLVQRVGPLSPSRACHLIMQTTRALAEAHQKGIEHRDLKPENIFITSAGIERDFVKLLDFGIAKQLDDAESLTATGSIIGTPLYISPEAARGRRTDVRSDIYAIGALLYFILTGEPPYHAPDVPALLLKHITEPIPALPPHVPDGLKEVVKRCLQKDPRHRFRDARQLLAALEGATSPDVSPIRALASPHPARPETGRALSPSAARAPITLEWKPEEG